MESTASCIQMWQSQVEIKRHFIVHFNCITAFTMLQRRTSVKGWTHTYMYVLYNGKLSRKKTYVNFVVLWLSAKVFSAKFGGIAFLGTAKVSNPWKSQIRESFLPWNFSAIWYTPHILIRYSCIYATVVFICRNISIISTPLGPSVFG